MARVLVVDDHVGVAHAVEALVRSAQCDVAVAHSGEKALGHLRDHPVDLMVLDVSMPGMSGLDVLRELRTAGRLEGLPVLMFSASETSRAESLSLGAVAFVLKHHPEELLKLIFQYASGTPCGELHA